jgi:hypothetical protein
VRVHLLELGGISGSFPLAAPMSGGTISAGRTSFLASYVFFS